MSLFNLDGSQLVLKPEALALKSIKKIWDKDKTDTKEKAINELTFIYFVYDPRSDYQFITDEEERIAKVKEELGLRKNWAISKDLEKAIETYKETCQTVSSKVLENFRKILEKMNNYMIDTEIDEVGLDKVSNVINRLPDTIKKIQEAEQLVIRELEEDEKLRGEKYKKLCEDGFNFG